jgi:hypothetical protein
MMRKDILPCEEVQQCDERLLTVLATANAAGVSHARDIASLAANTAVLFAAFVLFLLEEISRTAPARLFFFAREGAFFRRLYEMARNAAPLHAALPPSRLLQVSRLATFGPSLASLDPQELMRLWRLYPTQSARELLRSLNLEPSDYGRVLARHGLKADEPVARPWSNPALQRFLGDDDFQRAAKLRLAEQRKLLLRYLCQEGLEPGIGNCLIVDIGWRGTIQDNIALLLPGVRFHGVYLGLLQFLNPQPPHVSKVAFGPNLNLGAQASNPEVLHFVAPVEMLTNSGNGSVKSYALKGDEVFPRCGDPEPERDIYDRFTLPFQNHVAALGAELFPALLAKSVRSNDLRVVALQVWNAMITDPPPILMEAYFGLQHDETFGLCRHVHKATRLDRFWPLKLLLLRSYRREFRRHVADIGWTPGYAKYYNEPLLLAVEKLLGQMRARKKRATARG